MQRIFFLLLVINGSVHAQKPSGPDELKYCLFDGDIGLGGYDPIGYFEQNAAIEGEVDITATHEGVIYQFTSEAHRKKFLAAPERYLPQFGGWCSMTLAMGQATTPKYDNFIIKDDKLFLFERTLSVNGRELWQQDPKTNKRTATKNYDQYKTNGTIN